MYANKMHLKEAGGAEALQDPVGQGGMGGTQYGRAVVKDDAVRLPGTSLCNPLQVG